MTQILDTLQCIEEQEQRVDINVRTSLCIHKAVSALNQHSEVNPQSKTRMLELYNTFKETYSRVDART